MSKKNQAGAVALLTAPIVVIVSAIVTPTLSDDAATRYTAIAAHRGAVIGAGALALVALVLLIAGTIWFALKLAPKAPGLALAGGILGVFGALAVMFENSIAVAMPTVVSGLDPAQATATLHRVSSAGAVAALEPVSVLQDLGLALLGLAAVRAGAPRWAGLTIAIGAFAEGAGFASGTKAIVIGGFAVLLLGLAPAVQTLLARTRTELRHSPPLDEATTRGRDQALVELQQA
jgi:hypothetical protein